MNLKRKRGHQVGPRKNRKLCEDVEEEVIPDTIEYQGGETHLVNYTQSEDGEAQVEEEVEEEEGGEAWMGIEIMASNESGGGDEPRTRPKKPPTGEELRTMKDAIDLFRSNSFKMQIDALLPNVRPKASRIPPLERFLFYLHSFVMNIPSVEPLHPLEASRRLLENNVAISYSLPFPTEDTNWKVSFEPPTDITLVGSWPNKICVKAKDGHPFGVDIAVEMPDSLFQEKDYLNGRFFQKRAFYLATIAAAIKDKKNGLHVDCLYDSLADNPRLTNLVLIPRKGKSEASRRNSFPGDDANSDSSKDTFSKLNVRICIIPVISPTNPIPLHRLSPLHSNIRINTSSEDGTTSSPATPMYNTALLLATTPRHQLIATNSAQKESPAFTDAVTLLRVWANQRGYGPGSKMCVRGFETRGPLWSALLRLLIFGEEKIEGVKSSRRGPLGRGLSSYQLFRAALDFLSKSDFEKDSVFLKTKDGHHQFSPEAYKEHYETVLVDSSSLVNLLAGIPLGCLKLLAHDARKTLEILNKPSLSGDPFAEVFLTDRRDLPTRFDTLLRVNLFSAKPRNPNFSATMDIGSPASALFSSISSILQQGLGDRIEAVAILHPSSLARPLTQAQPPNPSVIYIGLIHNPVNAFRLVDHGPAASEVDQAAVQNFRDFWGSKAELRRFKDGRILESVVWDVKTADERAHIPGMIVRHLLWHHFGLGLNAEKGKEPVQTWQASFDSLLKFPDPVSSLYREAEIATGFKAALTAFDELVRNMKTLDNDAIPLAVLNVSPVSEQLRYTSVFSPVPLSPSLALILPPSARYLGPIELILEFEKSFRWPDDLTSIQKMKLAFFERIASELMAKVQGLRANVVIGDDGVTASEVVDKASLEILTPDGWAFSVRIWNEREAVLLNRILEKKNRFVPPIIKQQKKTEDGKEAKIYREATEAKDVYMRRFIHAPRHHRAIATLSHQYGAFSGTVRLVKRWFAAHWLLHGHVSEEAVEILCARFFVGDGKDAHVDADSQDRRANVPGSKERGFATVVAFLKEWKWEEGLFVPLYGSAGANSCDANIKVHAGVWKLLTEADMEGHVWTSHGPDVVIAHRITDIARATWDVLQGMETGSLDVQAMFNHPTDDYDLVMHLDSSVLPRYFQNVLVDVNMLLRRGKYANITRENQDMPVRPGFDPARMLFGDLQKSYTHTFKVFHDLFGGDRFGLVWEPSLKNPRPFRVLGQFSSLPVKKESEKTKGKEKDLVELNKDAILSEVARMGEGLVKEMTLHVQAEV